MKNVYLYIYVCELGVIKMRICVCFQISRSVILHLLQNLDISNNGDGTTTLTCASTDTPTAEKTAHIAGIIG